MVVHWLAPFAGESDDKLVLRVGVAPDLAAGACRLVLEDWADLFAGGKLLYGEEDVLLIAYLHRDTPVLPQDALEDLTAAARAILFVPFNAAIHLPALIWVGASDVADAVCEPLL